MKSETRFEKSIVVHSIIDSIHHVGGRFLKKDFSSGMWYEMSRQQCKEKVGHAIRDAVNSFEARQKKKEKAIRDGYHIMGGAGSMSAASDMLMGGSNAMGRSHSSQKRRYSEMHHYHHHHQRSPPPVIDTDYSQRKRRRRSSSNNGAGMSVASMTTSAPLKPSPIQPPSSAPPGLVTRMPFIRRSPIARYTRSRTSANHSPPPMTTSSESASTATAASLPKVFSFDTKPAPQQRDEFQFHRDEAAASAVGGGDDDDNFDLAIDAVLGPSVTDESPPIHGGHHHHDHYHHHHAPPAPAPSP